MKKMFLFVILLASISSLHAQKDKTPETNAKPLLKTLDDSASYAVGVSVGNFYKQQGIKKINVNLVAKAISDMLGGKKMLLTETLANLILNKYISSLQEVKAKTNIDACQGFLEQNKSKSGVITTASGLQYEVLRDATGPKPSATDSVTCHYKGTLLNGTVFDNSYDRGKPITFSLAGVIKGWTEGLQLMSVGSQYKFYVPYTLGYGSSDYGPIPGGSLLTFEIELLDIKKKQ